MKRRITNVLILVLVSVFSLAIGASAATTIASTSVTYGDTTVKEALDELMTKANRKCSANYLCSKVKIGDYVKMTPTKTSYTVPMTLTGYTSDQTINPSELNLWRVIDIRSDGTIEMVSEYVSSTNVYFKGQTGYLNFVGTLNNIANQYGNSNYTIGARHIGYWGQTEFITDTSYFINSAPWGSSTTTNDNEVVGGGDVMYTYDTDSETGLVYKALGTLVANNLSGTATTYWLASRHYSYSSSTGCNWRVRLVNASGTVSSYGLYHYRSGWIDSSNARALRPIVTLKSDVQATGSGTSASPWVLS